jgi:hypothetical protein
LDGQDFFGRAMPVRWASSPEPIADQIVSPEGKLHFLILDFSRAAGESRVDVYPDEEQILDVAVRFDDADDKHCYGWNNEAYFCKFHNPNWKLPSGRYLVKVVITSSGQKCVGVFRLVNADLWTDCRLSVEEKKRLTAEEK